MKSPMLLNTAFFFLFVLLATTLPSTRAINVFDESGEPIRSGGTYYMIPVDTGSGGGPTLRQTGNDKCPLTIVQDTNSSSPGWPVTLTDFEDATYYIAEEWPVKIRFVGNKVPSCAPSLWGTVDDNLKVVNDYLGFALQDYYANPGKHHYVIADCYFYDSNKCYHVVSKNKTLVYVSEGNAWVVKFKRTYVNSERDSWSVV